MKRHLPATWVKVERLYLEGQLSVAQIAEQCQVASSNIYSRAKKYAWSRSGSPGANQAPPEHIQLRRLIGKKIANLEKRMDDPDTTTPAENERDVRAVASLLNSLVKLDAKQDARRDAVIRSSTDNAPTSSTAMNYGDENVDQWRHELARRIASLSAKRRL